MPTKRKRNHQSSADVKPGTDPLGRDKHIIFLLKHVKMVNTFFCSDDILRKNLFLSKHARPVEQQPKPLGR